jgi:glycosyltransferase involved in cell wall biosynthesis
MSKTIPLSVVIPTYQREQVLLSTIDYLENFDQNPAEIIVVDQTIKHERETEQQLSRLDENGIIRWIRLQRPSIPHAMNTGLLQAKHEIVLFLDDDIIPDKNLIFAHFHAHCDKSADLVAGRVIQPWNSRSEQEEFGTFRSSYEARRWVSEFMGGNFSVNRSVAVNTGGFDENFVKVAYRFERDFADRIITSGSKILFEPDAVIRHLKVSHGGTRSYGEHLTTIKPSHSVGEYYYLLRSKIQKHNWLKLIIRPFQSIKTKHHLHRPWWIPVTFTSEILGLLWAVYLNIKGPKYIGG